MKQKIKDNVAEGSVVGKRPPSQVQKTTTPQRTGEGSDEDYDNNDFEDDAAGNADD